MELNLNDPDFFSDPYPFYAEIRSSKNPFWLPHEQLSASKGIWLFGRYNDALTIFKQTTCVSKNIRTIHAATSATPFDLNMLFLDAPDHLRLRRLVAKYFSAEHLRQLEPFIEMVADELINGMQKRGEVDLITNFAEQMPLRVIAKLIGVPESDMPQIRAWSLEIGQGFDSVISSNQILLKQKNALRALLAYADHVVTMKRDELDNSFISFLIKAGQKGEISQDEITGMLCFLLFAGHETTINLIGNGLWLLLNHPEQCELLRLEPELMSNAVEEILRYESPEQRTSFRVTVEPFDIAGIRLEPGQQLGVIIGSANRDETAFHNPDKFDITRADNRHLAFGVGTHNCLGKHLARLEAKVAFGRMLPLLPDIRLLKREPCWRKNSFFRGLESLPAMLR